MHALVYSRCECVSRKLKLTQRFDARCWSRRKTKQSVGDMHVCVCVSTAIADGPAGLSGKGRCTWRARGRVKRCNREIKWSWRWISAFKNRRIEILWRFFSLNYRVIFYLIAKWVEKGNWFIFYYVFNNSLLLNNLQLNGPLDVLKRLRRFFIRNKVE